MGALRWRRSLATAAIVWLGRRLMARGKPAGEAQKDAPFGMLTVVSMIGIVLHIAMDVPTSYGTRFLSPFNWQWFAVDLMPIVDVYLLVVLLAGLVFGGSQATSRHRNAAVVLVLMAAGLFVDPAPGPVLANFGVDHLRFLTPVKAGDAIRVTLTVKQITPRTTADYGEVRWDAVVTNAEGEPVATYDVLTLVAKEWPPAE